MTGSSCAAKYLWRARVNARAAVGILPGPFRSYGYLQIRTNVRPVWAYPMSTLVQCIQEGSSGNERCLSRYAFKDRDNRYWTASKSTIAVGARKELHVDAPGVKFLSCVRQQSSVTNVAKDSAFCKIPESKMSAEKAYIELNNGHKMPIIGLGTWQGQPEEVAKAVKTALELGYRHIDTAYSYKNETGVGEALKEVFNNGKIKREDVFVVTKLPVCGMRPEHVKHFLDLSLKNLQLDYVDLYLVHTPFGFMYRSDDDIFPVNEKKEGLMDMNTDLPAIWKKMEEMVDLGLAKSIGVSNFTYEQIERVMKGSKITPATNQVECHAYLQQKKLHQFCKKNGITITAYAPIGSPGSPAFMEKYRGVTITVPNLLGDPKVEELSKKYKKAPSQILLRFLIQKGIIVIPKSCTPSRIKENFDVFDFQMSPEDMAIMDDLDRNERMFKFDFFKGMTNHPEYKKWIEYNNS